MVAEEVQPTVSIGEETYEEASQQAEHEEYASAEETAESVPEEKRQERHDYEPGRSGFLHGLSVGLGISCIATFVIIWITLFFTPQMPSTITYETLLSVFIYPLIYLLTVGLIALTAGIVREYFVRQK